MSRVLITAFEPYGQWPSNASWLALVELTKRLPAEPKVTTRLYPVDFDGMRRRVEQDLASGYDFALHLGQAPGTTAIQLETVAINVRRDISGDQVAQELAADSPVAFRATLPMQDWVPLIHSLGIPCELSYHAGVYVCNATLYWNRLLCERHGWSTRSGFIHLPLEPSQTINQDGQWASLPAPMVAEALLAILNQLSELRDT
jgi:pyroglutamyl-peptidase